MLWRLIERSLARHALARSLAPSGYEALAPERFRRGRRPGLRDPLAAVAIACLMIGGW